MDKISGLPDELLLKILSFLPTKEAVSTSVLSKRWRFLWMWLPKLRYRVSDESVRDFINGNLPLHRAPVIESLGLELCYEHIEPEDIKRWVEIAASRYVRELEITYPKDSEETNPISLFTCKSLVILKLGRATIMEVPSVVCFPSLKSLQLNQVVYADKKYVQELLAICPVLEDLDLTLLEDDDDMKGFTVSVPSLQKLTLHVPCLDGYKIDTPSLKYLKLVDYNHREHYSLFANMPQIKEVDLNVQSFDLKSFVRSIKSVEHLTICTEDAYSDGVAFNQLEHLELCVCQENSSTILAQLLKDSPNLRVLDITSVEAHDCDTADDLVCWNQALHVPECILSSLQIFNWSRYFGRPTERDIAVYILKNARHLQKATFLADTWEHNVSNIEMIKKLTLSPRASSTCELVFVDDKRDDGSE